MAEFNFFNPPIMVQEMTNDPKHPTTFVDSGYRSDITNLEAFKKLGLRHTSYSGVDIRAVVHVAGGKLKEIATLQSLSVSSFRDKRQVRALGTVYDKGVTRGPRTIAGTMIFTIFEESALAEILRVHKGDMDRAAPHTGSNLRYAMMDQLPPFDVTINFMNEYGFGSRMAILGCELHSEGQVMSIEDILTEQTVQYTARSMVFMHSTDDESLRRDGGLAKDAPNQITFDSILRSNQDHLGDTLKTLRRVRNSFR